MDSLSHCLRWKLSPYLPGEYIKPNRVRIRVALMMARKDTEERQHEGQPEWTPLHPPAGVSRRTDSWAKSMRHLRKTGFVEGVQFDPHDDDGKSCGIFARIKR